VAALGTVDGEDLAETLAAPLCLPPGQWRFSVGAFGVVQAASSSAAAVGLPSPALAHCLAAAAMHPPGAWCCGRVGAEEEARCLEQAAATLEAAARHARAAARSLQGQARSGHHQQQQQQHLAAAPPTGWANATSGEAARRSTTIMLRNLPNNYSRDMLLEMLDREGFSGLYDFAYYPVDFKRWAGLGYAFVNLTSHEEAVRAWRHFEGYAEWTLPSLKVVDVCWGSPLQGLAECTERYRNSAVMHEDVPDMFKPVVFRHGHRVPFPAATKSVRNPRWKHK